MNRVGGRKENIMIRLPIIALLVSILISMTGCKFRSSPYNRPEYSKEDVLYTKYSGLLEQIDNNIDRSDSVSRLRILKNIITK